MTFDKDMTLKIFVNNGLESFALRTIAPANDPHFAGAQPPYLLADFGSGVLGLAAPVVSQAGQIGMLLLQGDGAGGFTPATGEVPLELVRGSPTTVLQSKFIQVTGTPVGSLTADVPICQTIAAQFRSSLHGDGRPDFAFVTEAREAAQTLGECPGDNTPPPPPRPLRHQAVCPERDTDPADCGPHHTPCFTGICCNCNDLHIPLVDRCPNSCPDFPQPVVPFTAFCDRMSSFTPVLTVLANTCGD